MQVQTDTYTRGRHHGWICDTCMDRKAEIYSQARMSTHADELVTGMWKEGEVWGRE